MPAPVLRSTAKDECPASFLEERFPTGGNDTTCTIIYDAVYKYMFKPDRES